MYLTLQHFKLIVKYNVIYVTVGNHRAVVKQSANFTYPQYLQTQPSMVSEDLWIYCRHRTLHEA